MSTDTITKDLSGYSAIEKLRNGKLVEIRAIRPEDRDELLNTVSRASKESRYTRFFSPKHSFSEKEVDYFLKVDFVDHVALVAVIEEGDQRVIAGGSRYIVSGPGQAEVAFGLEDSYQGMGIASLMIGHLSAIARAAEISEFHADVLPGNLAMLKVFEKSSLGLSTKRDGGTVHVVLRLR
jgi:RimJ/RimL family protein N-acetyltransferase